MRISSEAFEMIKRWEGCPTRMINGQRMAVPYRDAVGIWTIGYGFITVHGRKVTAYTEPMTMQQVDVEFLRQLQKYINGVDEVLEVEVTPSQLGALTSFAYNLGVSAFQRSTLLRKINACEWDEVERQFLRWNRAGGRKLKGLTRRRQAEADMFLAETTLNTHLAQVIDQRECDCKSQWMANRRAAA